MKRTISLILLLIVLLSSVISVFAEQEVENEDLELTSLFAAVYNFENDRLIYAKDNKSMIYPASLTKIMTGALAVEYFQSSSTEDFDVTVTESALANVVGNNIGLKAGEMISYKNLLYALLVGSANDAAYVLAERIAGSAESFVALMNEKARELGALDTTFTNPTGYHSPYMMSTLDDMVKICAWAYKNNTFMAISSEYKYTIPKTNLSDERYLQSQNLLLNPTHWGRYYIEGVKGMNSGATNESGYCLATVMEKGGLTNLVIITGGITDGAEYLHFRDAQKLIDHAFNDFENKTVIEGGKIVCELPVDISSGVDHAVLTTEEEVTYLFNKSVDIERDVEITYKTVSDRLVAPVMPGVSYGVMEAYYDGELIASTNLVSQITVDRSNFLYMLGNLKALLMTWQVKLIIGITVGIIIFFIALRTVLRAIAKKRRERKNRDDI